MRALETGRYLLRVTNTGVTAIVAPNGHIIKKLESFKRAVLRGEIFPMKGMTLYASIGDETIIAMLFAGLIILLITSKASKGMWKKNG